MEMDSLVHINLLKGCRIRCFDIQRHIRELMKLLGRIMCQGTELSICVLSCDHNFVLLNLQRPRYILRRKYEWHVTDQPIG